MNGSCCPQKKATRWRMERNWWISALTFTIYWCVRPPPRLPSRALRRADSVPPLVSPSLRRMLWRFHAMKKQLLRAQRKDE